jgi:hypothetical protein
MDDKNDEVEIVLDDTPEIEKKEEVEIVAEPVAKDEKKRPDPDDGIEELRKRLEQERAARVEAEKRAFQATEQVNRAAIEVEDTQYHLVKSAFDTVKRDQELLRGNLRDAMQIGDYDKAAEINETMSMNNIKLSQLEQGLVEMQSRARAVQEMPRQQAQRPQNVNETVNDLINRVTPLSARWLQENKSHIRDDRSLRIVARAHEDALDMGIIPESNEYFELVETRLGIKRGEPEGEDNALSAASAPTQRRSSPPAAPVSRGGANTRPGVIRLTKEQAEAAKISGLTPQEYYRQLVKERNRAH